MARMDEEQAGLCATEVRNVKQSNPIARFFVEKFRQVGSLTQNLKRKKLEAFPKKCDLTSMLVNNIFTTIKGKEAIGAVV